MGVTNPNDSANYPQSYAYDPAGNLTSSSSGNPSVNRAFTYNNLNERITDAGIAQQFDTNGNLSSGMGFTLGWDAEDRVKTISFNGTQRRVEYDYDGLGRRARIRLMESGVKTAEYLYIWDSLKLCEKRDSAIPGFPVALYYPQGERKFLSGTYINYFYLRDRLGSVRGATSATGSIIQNADYLPYGPPAPQQPVSTDPDFGFTGHLKCPFTGLTLAPYRALGYASWLSRDPIGEDGGINLYGYVSNNPVNLVDPDGRHGRTLRRYPLVMLSIRQLKLLMPSIRLSKKRPQKAIERGDAKRILTRIATLTMHVPIQMLLTMLQMTWLTRSAICPGQRLQVHLADSPRNTRPSAPPPQAPLP